MFVTQAIWRKKPWRGLCSRSLTCNKLNGVVKESKDKAPSDAFKIQVRRFILGREITSTPLKPTIMWSHSHVGSLFYIRLTWKPLYILLARCGAVLPGSCDWTHLWRHSKCQKSKLPHVFTHCYTRDKASREVLDISLGGEVRRGTSYPDPV